MGSEERPNNSMVPCERIFIQRDYSSGTAVRFQTLPMPLQLRGRVSCCVIVDLNWLAKADFSSLLILLFPNVYDHLLFYA